LTSHSLRRFTELRREHAVLFIAVLALIALTAGIIANSLIPASVRADNADYSSFYRPVADSLVAGKGATINSHPATRYPVGFPLLVAVSLGTVRVFSLPDAYAEAALPLASLAVSSVILFAAAELLHGTAWALLSYFLWICCPWVLYLSAKPLSDLPFCCFLFAATYFLFSLFKAGKLSASAALLTGLLIGASMLVRPIGMFIGFISVVLLLLLTHKPPLRARVMIASLILVGIAIPVLPWEMWLYQGTHEVVLLSTGSTPSIRDGLAFASSGSNASGTNSHFKMYRHEIAVPFRAQEVSTDARNGYLSLTSGRAILQFLSEEVHRNMLGVTELYLVKAARSWYGSDSQSADSRVLRLQLGFLAISSIGLWGTWRMGGYRSACTVLCLVFVLYFWAMTILVLSILRYMVPAMGLLFLLVPGWRQFLYRRRPTSYTSVEHELASTYSHS